MNFSVVSEGLQRHREDLQSRLDVITARGVPCREGGRGEDKPLGGEVLPWCNGRLFRQGDPERGEEAKKGTLMMEKTFGTKAVQTPE